MNDKKELTFELLQELYVNKKLSIKDIKNITKRSANCIRSKIEEYQLTKELTKVDRMLKKQEINISKEELIKLYNDEELSIKDISEKLNCSKHRIQNLLEIYGISLRSEEEVNSIRKERFKINFKDKWGVEHPYQHPEIRDRMIKKVQETYKSGSPQQKLAKLFETGLPQLKSAKTKKENGSSNTSSVEERVYSSLCFVFGVDNVERQYCSKLYPFSCDFYIKPLNLYIELNCYFTHGPEPYNPNNPDHQKLIKSWKTKAQQINYKGKTKEQFNYAVKNWTQKDPLKRETAKKNNLNYLEFFKEEDFYNWLNYKRSEKPILEFIEKFSIQSSSIDIQIHHNLEITSSIKDPYLYQMKSKLAEEQGIFLYHIFEHEWQNPIIQHKIINQLKNLFKLNTRIIYARKCEIREVGYSEAKEFLDLNHLQGSDKSPVRLGLYYENELVALMTFCKPRFNKNYDWELGRFCCLADTNTVGGASRLFKYFLKNYNPKNIISYSDIAKTQGGLYSNLGFKLQSISKPNYVWYANGETLTRYKCQKYKLIEKYPQYKDLSETQIMESLGYIKVHGCGNKVWVYQNP